MATRTVTGTCYHVDGSPWVLGSVKFTLTQAFETATVVYPAETHSETLDATGAFSVVLGVPDTGTVMYKIVTPDQATYYANLGAGAPTTLTSLLTIASSAVAQDAAQTLIDANNILSIVNPVAQYTIQDQDDLIRCDGTFAVLLPPATGSGLPHVIKNIGTGVITITPDGTDTIDGMASYSLVTLQNAAVIDVASGKWDML